MPTPPTSPGQPTQKPLDRIKKTLLDMFSPSVNVSIPEATAAEQARPWEYVNNDPVSAVANGAPNPVASMGTDPGAARAMGPTTTSDEALLQALDLVKKRKIAANLGPNLNQIMGGQ